MVAVKQKNPLKYQRYDIATMLPTTKKGAGTAIYKLDSDGYMQFVSGTPCRKCVTALPRDRHSICEYMLSKRKNPKTQTRSKTNPHGFFIVDEHLNIQKRGASYDKLQAVASSHNNKHGEKWFVIDADDYKEAAKKPNGKDRAIRYVFYIDGNSFGEWRVGSRYGMKGYGAPNNANLEKQVYAYLKSFNDPKGANHHIVKSRGTLEHFSSAYIKDQKTGEIVARWKAPAFMVLDTGSDTKYVNNPEYDFAVYQGKKYIGSVIAKTHDAAKRSIAQGYGLDVNTLTAKKRVKIEKNTATEARGVVNPKDKKRTGYFWKGLDLFKAGVEKKYKSKIVDTAHDSGWLFLILQNGKVIQVDTSFYYGDYGYAIIKDYSSVNTCPYLKDKTWIKRNATASDFRQHQSKRLTDLAKMFQGTANGDKKRVLESDYTPKDKYRLGYLVQVKIKDGGRTIPIDFDGESYLAGDLKNNLWIVGKDARISNIKLPPKGQMKYLGELTQIDYVTAKKHIEGGKTVRFYHKLGEVTKEKPNFFIDDEGFPVIVGGGYDVWDVGIVN